jgi:glycosyltransferase involved in cell wall biosynthesis
MTELGLQAPAHDLRARLDSPLPAALAVGHGNAVFVCGSCFHPSSDIRTLTFLVDGEPQPLMAQQAPRLDVFEALHPTLDPLRTGGIAIDPDSEDDPQLRSYRSGFWGILELDSAHDGTVDVGLRATLREGGQAEAHLGRIELRAARDGAPALRGPTTAEPLVAICMATHEPPLELFEQQVESIRAQTHHNWVCVISDDRSTPDRYAAIEGLLEGDERFVVSRSPERLGFYANFERCLSMAPEEAAYVAMADQDDRWDREKLEVLLGAIGDAELVYSDTRIVDRNGQLISETYWSHRRNNHTNLVSLLIANTVTGAASLFRREVLDLALPFPAEHGMPYHDHWLGCVALASGEVAYVDRPLYDYVQHGDAALGHARANALEGPPPRTAAQRLRRIVGDPRALIASWRAIYFWDICRIILFATVLERRCGERMSLRKRRALRRLISGEQSLLAIAWLLLRGARSLVGRNETLGVEAGLVRGIAWRNAVTRLAGRRGRPGRHIRFSASLPRRSSLTEGPRITHRATRTLADKTRPLDLSVRSNAPPRVNLLIPTIDLNHFFGGYITKLNLARRLAERGLRARLVTVDETPPLPRSWQHTVESYEGLNGVFDLVEVAFAREEGRLEVSPADRFIATTWWTAHLAHAALPAVNAERFLYLIQECEPFSFPMGAFAAMARQSYDFPHFALFSTEFLREYFRRHSLGVYAGDSRAGDSYSAAFENAITRFPAPTTTVLSARASRRLLLYARPEAHAARNMFELAILALARAVSEGVFGPDWELHGVGATGQGEPPIDLGAGRVLELLPRRSQNEYADLLRAHDVGLSLMYTPHPSLVPIEMAAAGMLTVTNGFENKTPEAMRAISGNMITVEPSIEAIASGLREAVEGVGQFDRRAQGARVNWSRDWNSSFDDELMERIGSFLESC